MASGQWLGKISRVGRDITRIHGSTSEMERVRRKTRRQSFYWAPLALFPFFAKGNGFLVLRHLRQYSPNGPFTYDQVIDYQHWVYRDEEPAKLRTTVTTRPEDI